MSYGFIGVLESMQMRASWDDKYSKGDIMRNLLAMFMAVRAAYSGRVDLTEDWKRGRRLGGGTGVPASQTREGQGEA